MNLIKNMNISFKRVLASSVLILVILAGIFYTYKTKEESSSGYKSVTNINQTIVATLTVTIGEKSFSPEIITIKKNTKVIFQNTAHEPRWPASNIHPTHGVYPEFDPQHPIQPGESWSFIFTKVGKWKMHDHLVPRILGTIQVTE